MAPIQGLDSLSNALATLAQLSASSSSLDGVPTDLEVSVRFAGSLLTQAAGVLLRLPQEVIAQAVVIFSRFWIGPEGGSLAIYSAKVRFCVKKDWCDAGSGSKAPVV
jgi:cyclin L